MTPEPSITPTPSEAPEPDEEDKQDEEIPSNQPEYTINIPARIMLNESSTFTISTIPSSEAKGNVIVTVEGTEAPNRQNFALYCGESCWEYKLVTESQELTPQKNQALFSSAENLHEVEIVSAPESQLYAGTYTGSLTFSVAYQPDMTSEE